MSLNTKQVTLGSTKTQVSTTSIPCRQVTIQNNATHVCRAGDTNVTSSVGFAVYPSSATFDGSATWGSLGSYCIDLKNVYILGTSADVIDVIYVD